MGGLLRLPFDLYSSEHVASAAGGDTPGSGTWTYGYDGSNRMISATGPGNQETTYGYDNAGNRTSVRAGNATPVTTTYDASGLAISSNGGTPQDAADDTTYINDASGRLVGIDAPGTADDRCYSYDRFDLLNDFSKGSTSGCDLGPGFHWGYDAFNRPSDKTYNTTTGTVTLDSYSYVGTSSELTQIATTTWYPSQRTATNYAGTPFGPLAQSDASGTRFDITDLHGDLVGTVATSGAIAGSQLYSPWGEPQASSGQGSVLGFQGQPTDADTGFVKTDTRLYDATQGRFTTQASLFGDSQSPGSLNQFGYGEGNPVTNHDPLGLSSTSKACSPGLGCCYARAYPPGTSPTAISGAGNVRCDQEKKVLDIRVNIQLEREPGSWERVYGETKLCDDTKTCGHTTTHDCIESGNYRTEAIVVVVSPGKCPAVVRSKKVSQQCA